MGHEGLPDTDDEKAEVRAKGLRMQSYREQVVTLSQKVAEGRSKVTGAEDELREQKQHLQDDEDALDILLTEGRRMLGEG